MGNPSGNLAALVVIVVAAVLSSLSFRTSAFTLAAAAYGFFLLFWLGDVRTRPPRYEQFRQPPRYKQFQRPLTMTEFAAFRKYHFFLMFPGSGQALSAFLNLLRLAATVWGLIALWKAEYWLGAVLLVHWFVVGFLCLRFDPIRYMIGSAQKGNDVAREQLMLIDRVQRLSSDQRARPFYENKSKADQADWFANAPGWNRVDSRLISALIDRLNGNPMFEVFVHASQDCGVIAKYEPLRALFDRGVGIAAIPRVAEILCTAGAAQGAKFTKMFQSRSRNQKKLSQLYANAMNACEASIHLESNYLPPYVHLALLRSMLDNKDDAAKFCKRGLEAVTRLRSAPFHRSELPEIKNAHRDLDKIEDQLKSILASLE